MSYKTKKRFAIILFILSLAVIILTIADIIVALNKISNGFDPQLSARLIGYDLIFIGVGLICLVTSFFLYPKTFVIGFYMPEKPDKPMVIFEDSDGPEGDEE